MVADFYFDRITTKVAMEIMVLPQALLLRAMVAMVLLKTTAHLKAMAHLKDTETMVSYIYDIIIW